MSRILVACIGNIFFGDDAFGVEVARKMRPLHWPDNVIVKDFGIRGMDLAFTLLDGYSTVILVDTLSRGGAPGTVYVMEPHVGREDAAMPASVEAHSVDPVRVLQLARSLGASWERLLLVGCEPSAEGCEEGRMELSEPVAAAIGKAIRAVERLIAEQLAPAEN